MPARKFTDEQEWQIRREYEAGTSSFVLAEKWGTNHHTIKDAVVRSGGSVRKPGHVRLVGRRLVQRKQVLVTVAPDDPFVAMAYRGLRVPEHRLVMARHLERRLRRDEQVHHINGDPHDNRLENLQLRRVANHGSGSLWQCRTCGSHDVVAVALPD